MRKNWGRALLAIVVLLGALLACGPVAPKPGPCQWDGTWTGVTIQEKHIELVVTNDTVTQIEFGAVIRGDEEIPTEQSLSVTAPIGDDGSFHVYDKSKDWLVEVKGAFQEDRVEGVVVVTYLPTEKWELVTFVATQEV